VTEVLHGLGPAERERVAALRAQGRFFWLDVALDETSRDDVAEALEIPPDGRRALSASGEARSLRTSQADSESVAFSLSGYVESQTPSGEGGYRQQPVQVRVVVTGATC
jgi:hypothetical protein